MWNICRYGRQRCNIFASRHFRKCLSTAAESPALQQPVDDSSTGEHPGDVDQVFGMRGDTLARYRNMGAVVLPDHVTTITPVRGLGSNAFNFCDGLYSITLAPIFMAAKISAMSHKDTVVGKLSGGFLTYEVVVDMTICKALYTECAKNWYLWNLQVLGQLLYCGNSSYTYKMTLQDQDSKEVLATFVDKAVLVSPDTRRVVSVPKELADCGIESGLDLKTGCHYKVPDQIPPDASSYSYSIMYSDTDTQGHTNTLTYIRLFLDFATKACYQGAFEGFGKYLKEYQVSRIISHYAKDSMFTDQVHVHVWQDTSYDMLLHCAISCNGECIYYGDMMFYN